MGWCSGCSNEDCADDAGRYGQGNTSAEWDVCVSLWDRERAMVVSETSSRGDPLCFLHGWPPRVNVQSTFKYKTWLQIVVPVPWYTSLRI